MVMVEEGAEERVEVKRVRERVGFGLL